MTEKTITLLAGARNIAIDPEQSKGDKTTIVYDCPAWKSKKCVHQLSGKWVIKKIALNRVTVITHDKTIPHHDTNI